MSAPLTAPDEAERLAALERYAIVDTTPEDEFDELVKLASAFCRAPIALISLVDESRQWFKARVGLAAEEIPRAMSFCAHALAARDLFVVHDARADPRFAGNPLVTGDPHIRFYAGAPLITPDGHTLGTLCILDHHPRVLDDAQRAALAALARQVVVQLELRRQICDKGAAEEALRSSEARLQRVLEGSNDGFWDWKIDTGFVQFSERAATMLGYALSDLVPHVSTWERLIHPDDVAGVMAVLQEHLAGRIEQYETEHRLRCADGQWMWILDRGKVVERDPHGQPLRMAGTHTDISKRKRAERELDRFFDVSLDLLCIAGIDGTFRRLNPAFEGVLGFSLDELRALTLTDLVHPDDKARTAAELGRLRQGLTTRYFENRYVRKDGSIRWIAWTASPALEDGLIYAAGRDITPSKMAEHELRRSETRTRSIIDNALGGVITTDERGIIESVNPSAERIFGYGASELAGCWLDMLLDPSFDRDHALGRVTEVQARRRNGEVFTCEISLFEFYAADDQRHFAANVLDVSERHVVERMKRDFISTVSHELRTPLTAIRGSLGLLASGVMGELPGEARAMVSVAERNSVRLISLINDILDFDRLESGKMEMSLRPTSLMRILERSIESISAVAVQEGVAIELHCENVNAMGDEERLMQVTVNLLSNAVKYSPRGDRVSVRAALVGKDVEVRVEDHGRGIAPDLQKKLFRRFQRADSSDSRRKPGTGLGLAICKAIVEQHGGSVGVESEEGGGSTFWFRVPAAVEASETDVLLVEDDRTLLEVMVAQLSATGLRVRTATSGWEGLASIRDRPPSLLVLDLELPDLDGFGVVAALRNDQVTCSVPLVVFSGMDLTSAQRSRLQLGPTWFLVKSRATDVEFCAAVTQLLAQPRARGLS
jgi:PAS domain S-box-containing protein